MLTELCKELRNWFVKDKEFGEFTIENGQITVPEGFLQEGQYFRIIGSVFNDGVHQYMPDSVSDSSDSPDLIDEAFEGAIWAMAVPPTVIALSDKIKDWMAMYGGVDSQAMSPYQSESFGGYSYTKASGGNTASGGSSVPNWKSVFANELNRWRKI